MWVCEQGPLSGVGDQELDTGSIAALGAPSGAGGHKAQTLKSPMDLLASL